MDKLVSVDLILLDENGNEDVKHKLIFIATGYAHDLTIERFKKEAEYNNTICGIHGKKIKEMIEVSLRDCLAYESMQPYPDKKEFTNFVEYIQKIKENIQTNKRYRITTIGSDFRNIELVQPQKKAKQNWYDWITRLLKK